LDESVETSAEALRLRLLKKQVNQIEEENRSIQSRIHQATEYLARLDNVENVPIQDIRRLGIANVTEDSYSSAFSRMQLRNKLSAFADREKATLEENDKKLQDKQESVRILLRCPECNGQGSKIKSHYERDEEGDVKRDEEVVACPKCLGSGKSSLASVQI
jgi:hypothetical protein